MSGRSRDVIFPDLGILGRGGWGKEIVDLFPDCLSPKWRTVQASDPDRPLAWILKAACKVDTIRILKGGPRTRSRSSTGLLVPTTSLCLMLRRREVEEQEVQYYDLASRSFDRSTSLVGVVSMLVLFWRSLPDLRSLVRDPLLSRRTRAPEILDGNNEGHAIPFPVRNEGLIGIEGNFRKIKTSVFRNRNLDPKTSPRQN